MSIVSFLGYYFTYSYNKQQLKSKIAELEKQFNYTTKEKQIDRLIERRSVYLNPLITELKKSTICLNNLEEPIEILEFYCTKTETTVWSVSNLQASIPLFELSNKLIRDSFDTLKSLRVQTTDIVLDKLLDDIVKKLDTLNQQLTMILLSSKKSDSNTSEKYPNETIFNYCTLIQKYTTELLKNIKFGNARIEEILSGM